MLCLVESCVSVILESNLRAPNLDLGLMTIDRQSLFYLSSNFVFKLVASKRALKSDIAIAHGFVFKDFKCSEIGLLKRSRQE